MQDDNYLKIELYSLISTDNDVFEFIQASSLDGLWYWDLENPKNEWLSPKFWTTLGYDPSEKKHLASEWKDVVFPEDFDKAVLEIQKHFMDSSYPFDQILRYHHKNGSIVWIRCRGIAIRNQEGKPLRMLGTHTDITLLKNTEEKIVNERNKYRKFLELASDGIFIMSPDTGCLIEYSQKAKNLLGYTDEEMQYLSVLDWDKEFSSIEDYQKIIALLSDEPINIERKHTRKDGSTYMAAITAVQIVLDGCTYVYASVRILPNLCTSCISRH